MIENQPASSANIPPMLAAAIAPDPLSEADRARLTELKAERARCRDVFDQAAAAMTHGASACLHESRVRGPGGFPAPQTDEQRADRATADVYRVARSELEAATRAVVAFRRELVDRERREAAAVYERTRVRRSQSTTQQVIPLGSLGRRGGR
jgi:hypothetical protein